MLITHVKANNLITSFISVRHINQGTVEFSLQILFSFFMFFSQHCFFLCRTCMLLSLLSPVRRENVTLPNPDQSTNSGVFRLVGCFF